MRLGIIALCCFSMALSMCSIDRNLATYMNHQAPPPTEDTE